jgi:enoyl-[acyl-carrier protein] reductase I
MFSGKRALVLGVANKRSIAWAIARKLADGGAQIAFTFQGERIEKSVRELAGSVSSPLVTELDVRDDAAIARVFGEVADAFGGELDILVHSVAFAAAEDLEVASPTRHAIASGWRSTSAPTPWLRPRGRRSR